MQSPRGSQPPGIKVPWHESGSNKIEKHLLNSREILCEIGTKFTFTATCQHTRESVVVVNFAQKCFTQMDTVVDVNGKLPCIATGLIGRGSLRPGCLLPGCCNPPGCLPVGLMAPRAS